ncbi:ABC transporter ATP-binding protein [Castellaniella sp. GW247-6E4]|uniref:ABC transporter ATP-binding protein n=1 Tax=Castellaniella sp. GW247-6E4 TaxID=3140380 RepID=UPI003315459D
MTALLEANRISKSFRGLRALSEVSLRVDEDEIVGLVGPNGAGKTTAFNLMSGVTPPTEGDIHIAGQRINGMSPHRIVRLGLARTFQATTVFHDTTVVENVRRGLLGALGIRFFSTLFNTASYREQTRASTRRAYDVLERVGLSGHAHASAATLAYGHQRLLGIAIALAADPKILLLDEPAAGLNPAEAQMMGEMIVRLHKELKISVLLVEHNMRMVMGICDRLFVLQHGQLIAQGTPQQIRNDPRVISAYLGSDDDEAA